jgi:hypothetical protein
MALHWSSLPKWLTVLLIIGFSAAAGFVYALFEMPATQAWGRWAAVLQVGALFASLGCIFGAAVALDGRSGTPVGDYPMLRTAICAIFGAVTVLVVWSWSPENFHPAWSSIGAAVGAVLGWLGWRWAKYVEYA